jgi:DNA-binding NarL/FixJ family response regulator
MENKPVQVVVVDDHPLVRAGMRSILESLADIQIVGEGDSGNTAIQLTSQLRPDVLILDINLPDINGMEVTRRLRAEGATTAILILTVLNDSPTIFGLFEAGASGYLLKDDALELLGNAIRAVARGETWLSSKVTNQVVQRALGQANSKPKIAPCLTGREMDVLRLLAQGYNNEVIARRLALTMRTVQNHVSAIYGKLGVDTRAEAVLYALRSGLVNISTKKNDRQET